MDLQLITHWQLGLYYSNQLWVALLRTAHAVSATLPP